jgi:hypothetical protein
MRRIRENLRLNGEILLFRRSKKMLTAFLGLFSDDLFRNGLRKSLGSVLIL